MPDSEDIHAIDHSRFGCVVRLDDGRFATLPSSERGIDIIKRALGAGRRPQFPFVIAGERFDRLGQCSRQTLYFFGRALRGAGLPKVRAQIEIFHAEAIALTHAGFKVFRSGKIVKLWKMTGEFLLVFAG